MTDSLRTPHGFSIDVEDWFHILDCDGAPDPSGWDRLDSRVERCTTTLLDLLDRHGHHATFFVLGWVAERHPAVVAEIARRGHEIGSHSYGHELVGRLGPDAFRRDLECSLEALVAAGAPEIRAFRAPGFSIGPEQAWAFDILADAGITLDASLFLTNRAHGGWPLARRRPFEVWTANGARIMEVPVVPLRVAGAELPYSGGGYLRLLPLPMLKALFAHADHAEEPVIAYLHPREVDPSQPRMQLPMARRFKYYVGLDTVQAKLDALFAAHRFETLRYVADRVAKDPPLVLARLAA